MARVPPEEVAVCQTLMKYSVGITGFRFPEQIGVLKTDIQAVGIVPEPLPDEIHPLIHLAEVHRKVEGSVGVDIGKPGSSLAISHIWGR